MAPPESIVTAAQTIPVAEVSFQGSTVDAVGRLFTWRGRLYRAIHAAAAQRVERLFSCGLIDDLVSRKLFVPSVVTGHTLEGYGLVVEHQAISPLIYPYEWSFSMLRDAGLAVLEVDAVARRYGFQLADCHGYNVCFDGTHPVFVDLGSFVPGAERAWDAYEEFLASYWYPLRIWRDGDDYFARRALLGCRSNDAMTHGSFARYRLPPMRWLRRRHADLLALLWVRARHKLAGHGWLGRRLRRLSGPQSSAWGDYQAAYYDAGGKPRSSARFERVAAKVAELAPRTVLELGGNQGVLAQRLAGLEGVERVICTDRDEVAVDAAYRAARDAGTRVASAVLDFMFPMTNYAGNRPPFERYRSDAVVALALLHHLLLTQGLALDHVLDTMARYARRHLVLEFMPHGLSTPGNRVPVPPWYTEACFRHAFEERFSLLSVETLEENRVLYVGEVKRS